MIQIDEMDVSEAELLLERVNYGHLGCSDANTPYVIPVHYVFKRPNIYLFTTKGKKVEIIERNPNVCLQAEEVQSNLAWQSVLVNGTAKLVDDPKEKAFALGLIKEVNPSLMPAKGKRWEGNWIRENHEIMIRIDPTDISGRRTVSIDVASAKALPDS